jgi:hypothetical protein
VPVKNYKKEGSKKSKKVGKSTKYLDKCPPHSHQKLRAKSLIAES